MGLCGSSSAAGHAKSRGPFQQTVINRLQDLLDDDGKSNKSRPKTPAKAVPGPCLLVSSRPPNTAQKSFEEKPRVGKVLRCPRLGELSYEVGYACQKGVKPSGVATANQDDFFVILVGDINLVGVFDGHGQWGHKCSEFAATNVPKHFARDATVTADPLGALGRALSKTHEGLLSSSRRVESELSGTTATLVAFAGKNANGAGPVLYTAHVGDSRAVLARSTKLGALQAVDLTQDHRPSDPMEKLRIEAHGGAVRTMDGTDRVYAKNQQVPGLAMSRCLGDALAGRHGVSAEACLKERPIEKEDCFFLACSDGVWEFMTSQEAVDVIGSFSPCHAKQAAETLAEEARQRWLKEEKTMVDDITVVCVWLQPSVVKELEREHSTNMD